MEWSDILADPSLSDLPYKIETNEHGQIVMSPASNEHGYYQIEIGALLKSHGAGRVYSEASVQTDRGVKVADVAWCSDAFVARHAGENPFSSAPELCVEIRSPSNSRPEINEKAELYFRAGAIEVWVCDLEGNLSFMDGNAAIHESGLFPGFPTKVA